MSNFNRFQKAVAYFQTAILIMPVVFVAAYYQRARAATLTTRLVLISTSQPSAQATHSFSFDLITAGSLGSIEFEYCVNNPFIGTPCTAPAGLDVSAASLAGESGETGFIVDPINTTSNRLVITRPSLPATPQTVTYTFDPITNPSTPKQSVFVRISTFASIDATGPRTDSGAVAFSTTGPFSVGGYVPPYLLFCSGITVSADCTSIGGNFINFGELSTTAPRAATSQFTGSTNDVSGFSTSVFANTLTSGNKTINPLTVPSGNSPGTSQFGLNLRANTNPNVGQDPVGPGTATVAPDYDIPNQFVLKNGTAASSPISTDYKIFTVSYLVNVSPSQPPGIYNTTVTYIATAAF